MLGAALLAAGCWFIPNDDDVAVHTIDESQQVGKVRIALAIAPLLVPGWTRTVCTARRAHDARAS